MNFRLSSMNHERYWKAIGKTRGVAFRCKKLLYSVKLRSANQKMQSPFKTQLFYMTLKQILFAAVILSITYGLDHLWLNRIRLFPQFQELSEFNFTIPISSDFDNLFSAALIALSSISGIFLGLYYSNMSSVYSSRYANAPVAVRKLFENEIITNSSIKDILRFIIISLLMLILILFDSPPKHLATVFIFYYGIRNVVSFAHIGKRAFGFSDVYEIATPLYLSINNEYKECCQGHFFSSDISFQEHYQKLACNHLRVLAAICNYDFENSSSRNLSTLTFMGKNIVTIETYWNHKAQILFDSRWFPEKQVYKQWYNADDSEVSIALQTGTSISNTSETNHCWLEDELFELNRICLRQLIKKEKWHIIYDYSYLLQEAAVNAVKSNNLDCFLQEITFLQDSLLNATVSATEKHEQKRIALFEMCSLLYISVFLASYQVYSKYSVKDCVSALLDSRVCYEKCPQANTKKIQNILTQIEAERKIEAHSIVPNWYIAQMIASEVFKDIINLLTRLKEIYVEIIPSLANRLLADKKYTEALLVISRIAEIKSKYDHALSAIFPIITELEQLRIDKTLQWPIWKKDEYLAELSKVSKQLPQLWIKASLAFTLENENELKSYPDMLGHCYNFLCDTLVGAIANDDSELFREAFSGFWPVAMLYQEITRTGLKNTVQETNMPVVFRVYAAPLVEYCTISGYALIWGEITNTDTWKEIVHTTFAQIAEKGNGRTDFLKTLVDTITVATTAYPAVFPRELLRTGWGQKIQRAAQSNSKVKWREDRFGEKRYQVDDPIIRHFLSSSFDPLIMEGVYEVFAVSCINPRLNKQNCFHSKSRWEDKIDESAKA